MDWVKWAILTVWVVLIGSVGLDLFWWRPLNLVWDLMLLAVLIAATWRERKKRAAATRGA